MNKYIAIIAKQMKLILPLLLIFAAIYFLQMTDASRSYDQNKNIIRVVNQYSSYDEHQINRIPTSEIHYSLVSMLEMLMIDACILGGVIGFIQFWMPSFKGNWKFIIHRPIKRSYLLTCMLGSVIIPIAAACWAFWAVTCIYLQDKIVVPLLDIQVSAGLRMAILPIMCYLAVVMIGQLGIKNFLVKLPAVFTYLAMSIYLTTPSITIAYLTAIIFFLMTIPLIYNNFCTKEY